MSKFHIIRRLTNFRKYRESLNEQKYLDFCRNAATSDMDTLRVIPFNKDVYGVDVLR